MTNMRRLLQSPPLHLRDGGMFDGVKRAIGMGPAETITEKYARQDAELMAKMARNAPAPAPAPAASRAISGYAGNTALEGRMKAAGLRDGGDLGTTLRGQLQMPEATRNWRSPVMEQYDQASQQYPTAKLAADVLPGVGIATSAMDVASGVEKGNYAGAAADAIGLIPGFKAVKAAFPPNLAVRAAEFASRHRAPLDAVINAIPEFVGKHIGLRDGGDLKTGQGGHVPGSGSGDKIPAKYEPGEFVASNDMLDAAPGLREQLHELRNTVLAAKGMTPEQADAKALGGSTLRASAGFDGLYEDDSRLRPARPAASPYANGFYDIDKSVAHGERVNPTPSGHGDGRYGAPANPTTNAQDAALKAANAATTAAVEGPTTLRQSATGLAKTGWNAAKSVGPAVAAGIAGSALANSMRNIGRDDTPGPAQDIGAAAGIPTDGYAPAPKAQPYNFFTDNEAGRNIGNIVSAASTVPGVSMATGALRSAGAAATIGAAENIRSGRDAQAQAPAAASPAAASPYTRPGADATMPGQDPGRPTLRNPNEVNVTRQANGVMAFSGGPNIGKDGGDIAYTGEKTGPGGDRVSTVPGMSREEIDRTLTNPDGSRWSAGDNAIMAANLRDGINPYAGTSRAAGEQGDGLQNQLRQLAMSPAGTPGRKGALRTLTAMQGDETTRRGQDITERGSIRTAESSLRNSAATNKLGMLNAQREQGNADRSYNLAAGTQAQALGEKYRENAKKEFEVIGADGKPDLAAGQQSFDAVRQIFPGIESADEKTRNLAMADAKEMAGIFNKARDNDKVGWDALKVWEPKRPALSGMPDATGASTEQTGFFGGMTTIGASNGDTLMRRPDGTSLNLGKLTSRQRELLDTAKKSGWGN